MHTLRHALLVPVLALLHATSFAAQVAEVTTIVSASPSGGFAIGSSGASISADGRWVAFHSISTALAPGDGFGFDSDIFVKDRLTGDVDLVSVALAGVPANGESRDPSISANGRHVVFVSSAADLVVGDGNGVGDIFVRDRVKGTTVRVSRAVDGGDPNGASYTPRISAGGRFVVFTSDASNLVAGDSNDARDIFVHDRRKQTTELVSLTWTGAQTQGVGGANPVVSANGNVVVFESSASDLVQGLGAFPGSQIYLRDRLLGTTELISATASGEPADSWCRRPEMTPDGLNVVFESYAENLVPVPSNHVVGIFLFDRLAGALERVSKSIDGEPSSHSCYWPSLSYDARFVAFNTGADSLAGPSLNWLRDVYVHDRLTGVNERVSVDDDGVEGEANSEEAVLSADGRYVAFVSSADDLIPGGTNGDLHVFLHDRMSGGPQLAITNLVAGQSATLTIDAATPSGIVALGVSLQGQGSFGSVWGVLDLQLPVFAMLTLPIAADGSYQQSFAVPPTLKGSPFWVQGVDVAAGLATTVFGGVVE